MEHCKRRASLFSPQSLDKDGTRQDRVHLKIPGQSMNSLYVFTDVQTGVLVGDWLYCPCCPPEVLAGTSPCGLATFNPKEFLSRFVFYPLRLFLKLNLRMQLRSPSWTKRFPWCAVICMPLKTSSFIPHSPRLEQI